MSEWTYERIDRIKLHEVHCFFCGRALRTERLIVMRNAAGQEVFSGPGCAKKHAGDPEQPILDLAKMAQLLVVSDSKLQPEVVQNASSNKPARKTRALRGSLIEADEAENYLRLRASHMQGFQGAVTQKLKSFHSEIGSDAGLSGDSRLYVERLLSKAKAENTIYSYKNIERCIGADYWLSTAIELTKWDRRDYLVSMQKGLHENWRLSSNQLRGINKWGEGIRRERPDFPILDEGAFEGVLQPKFAKS